jgi:hypothetical protein
MTRIIITLEYGGYSHKETQTQAQDSNTKSFILSRVYINNKYKL